MAVLRMATIPNSEYWRRRLEILQESLLAKGEKYLVSLEEQYRIAQNNIENNLNVWYARFAKNNEITMIEAKKLLKSRELEEFRWNVKDYIKYGKENALEKDWRKELENASARVHISRLESIKLQLQQHVEALYGNQIDDVDKLLREIYTDGYYHLAFEIQKGFKVGWSLQSITSDKLDKVLAKPWTLDRETFSDKIWLQKKQLLSTLQTELSQNIIRGLPPDKLIRNLTNKFKVKKYQAGRLVMTESAAFSSIAQKDCFNDLGVEKYEIVATLDLKTSEICQNLDGKVFEMKDYEVGRTAPPFHPWCRSVASPWFEDSVGLRFARDIEKEGILVPNNLKYHEWKEIYIDSWKRLELSQKHH